MPLDGTKEMYGTNSDCYADGQFTADCSIEEMIEFCIPHMVSANPQIGEGKARKMMKELFPPLNAGGSRGNQSRPEHNCPVGF